MNELVAIYGRYVATLSAATKDLFELQSWLMNWLGKNRTDLLQEEWIFLSIIAKSTLTLNSVLTLLPPTDQIEFFVHRNRDKNESSHLLPERDDSWKSFDLSGICSLTRDAIDASNAIFYLFSERVSKSESEFRFLLYLFHGYIREKEFIELLPFRDGIGEDSLSMIEEVKQKIDSNNFFNLLKSEMSQKGNVRGKRAKEILKMSGNGRISYVTDSLLWSRKRITEIRGMDVSEFDIIYKYSSSHIHSHAMGIGDIAGSMLMDNKSLMLLSIMTRGASFYASSILVDFIWNFPEAKTIISTDMQEVVRGIIQDGRFSPLTK
ncbi:MAG: hypothetical protein KME47_06200 [Nodosilinea sp. WJT8-NPBG4]|jgi:hypothetical protein|nr:hypothetical protein [Nodosilinea sp. WJT8-NPBG4]